MKFSVESEKENPALKRKELVVNVDYEGKATPKSVDLLAGLANHFSVPQEKLQAKLFSHSGKSAGYAIVKIWSEEPIKKNKRVKAAATPNAEEKK